jgi:methylthioribose-1-phosphate isomerase
MKRVTIFLAMLTVSTAAIGNDPTRLYAGALENIEKTHAVIQAMQAPATGCVAELEKDVSIENAAACAVFLRISQETLEQTRSAMTELQAACDNMQRLFDDRSLADRCGKLMRDSDALFADLDRIRHRNAQ